MAALVVDCIGRRRLLVPTFAIASAATFGLYFAPTDGGGGALLAVVGAYYSATEIVWSTLKTFTVELFPTEARGKAIGACTGVGFVGSSCALFVGPLLMAYAHPALPRAAPRVHAALGLVVDWRAVHDHAAARRIVRRADSTALMCRVEARQLQLHLNALVVDPCGLLPQLAARKARQRRR